MFRLDLQSPWMLSKQLRGTEVLTQSLGPCWVCGPLPRTAPTCTVVPNEPA